MDMIANDLTSGGGLVPTKIGGTRDVQVRIYIHLCSSAILTAKKKKENDNN